MSLYKQEGKTWSHTDAHVSSAGTLAYVYYRSLKHRRGVDVAMSEAGREAGRQFETTNAVHTAVGRTVEFGRRTLAALLLGFSSSSASPRR